MPGEGWHVCQRDACRLAVAAGGRDFDQACWRFQCEVRDRLRHGNDALVQQHGCDTDAVGAGHGWCVFWFHDDEAHLGFGIFCWHQQIDVTEDTATWFVQHKLSQCSITGDKAGLLPDRVAGWWGDTAHDHITHFAFGMAVDDVDGFCRPHYGRLSRMKMSMRMRSCASTSGE